MLIAQISDLHIQADGKHKELIQAERHLTTCIQALNRLAPRPDLVVITGDLTERGRRQEYMTLKPLLAELDMPYLLIPGNHDSPAMLREVFHEHAYLQRGPASDSPFIQYVIDDWPLRIVALDTTIPMRSEGGLCAERLQWLSDTLAQAPEAPTLILMHHPPFQTGIREMDELGLLTGREAFAGIIAPYHNIERILCGHLHRTMLCRVGPTVASTCPGTAHQIVLDLKPDAQALSFNFEPPGYQLHWQGAHGLVTHHAVIGEFPGPHPF
ncbi:phosphodiesterase [Pusillimonas sp. MFBS29]|uniref:phosphodiesterase n=1 Tax=Pusillimonas sp. MFBS29 TaxID=2886690 RepID=UPI001D0F58BD|nr:phosphodiesterase [Pusillimonas sp. MFBS29]MCC2596277.1 phosphodiesterase [Pusillimonas sp. MFBS29]